MQTDPISAAHAYRQALKRVLEAATRHEARQIAVRALDITFTPPEEGQLNISSSFGGNTQQAIVTVSIANPTESANPFVQLPAPLARQQAMYILEAAEAAETDGFIVAWLLSQDQEMPQIARVLSEFRDWRERQREGGPAEP